jgi:uncharacterized protein (DUF305 family)
MLPPRVLPWLTVIAIGCAVTLDASPADAPFLAENQAAMKKMMSAMDVKPTGDADVDFAATMIPHHQGAIDMAKAELHFGRNERLRRLAQEIIVEQGQEIEVMRQAIGGDAPPANDADGMEHSR